MIETYNTLVRNAPTRAERGTCPVKAELNVESVTKQTKTNSNEKLNVATSTVDKSSSNHRITLKNH